MGPFSRRWERRSNDVVQQGDLVEGVKKLVSLLGWSEAMEALMNRAEIAWKEHASTVKVNVERASVEIAKSIQKAKNGVEEQDKSRQVSVEHKRKLSDAQSVNGSCAKPNGVANGSVLSPFGSRTLHSLTNGSASNGVLYRTDKSLLFLNREGPMRSNVIAQRAPLLPYRNSQQQRNELITEGKGEDFKVIDPVRDLASAGFGLGKRSMGLGCFLAGNDDQSSSGED